MTGNYSDAAPPYGTPSEKSLYEAWDRHEFCYPILEKMIGSIEGIDTIFDLGCGSGEMLKRLSQLGKGADPIGIDSSEVAIDYASQKLGESAYLIHGDINDVPDIRGKKVLIYSSGFTSNLFSENQWRKMVVNWLRASPSVYAFVYDVFWWAVPLTEVHQNGVYEGDQSSLSWRVRRGAEAHTSHIQDSKNSRTTTLTSFNHRTRSISPANGFQCDEREVLQRKVKTAEGLLTESCTRVVTRSAR